MHRRPPRAAGFAPGPHPGHWVDAREVAVDLMVVPHQAGTTKASVRAARWAPHEKLTARIASGLEPALVDHAVVIIAALEPDDGRSADLRVAGPAALLAVEAIKISERLERADTQPDRLREKDALDAFRILQAVDTAGLVEGFASHGVDHYAAAVTAEALEVYRTDSSTAEGRIAQLAAAAAHGDPTVAPSFAALVRELLNAL